MFNTLSFSQLRNTQYVLRLSKRYPKAPFGIGPLDGPLFIAGHITGSALKALFVVKEDATIGQRDEKIGRANVNAAMNRAIGLTNLGVDDNVWLRVHLKAGSIHFFFKGSIYHPKERPP
jgi:hypothetical protein